MSTMKVDSIVSSGGTNTAQINGIPLRPGVLDPENRIINGAFDFWQRGTTTSAVAYAADRWYNAFASGTVTQSRQAFALGDTLGNNSPTYFLRQTVSGQTLATQFVLTQQRIEGVRSYAGQTITVLGWARRSSGSGNMTVEVTQNFGTGGSPSTDVTGTGQVVTLTGSWAPFAATFTVPSITGKTLGSNGNDFFALNIWTSAGSDWSTRSGSLGLQTIGVDLWGIHIKLGTHTTAAVDLYKQPELGPELARCQRYYYLLPLSHVGFSINTSTLYNGAVTFPVTMRTTPSMGGASFEVNSGNAGTPRLQNAAGIRSSSAVAMIDNSANNWGGVNTAVSLSAGFDAEL